MPHVLSILKEADPARHQRAVQGLADGSLTVHIVRHTDHDIRAIVKNGSGDHRVILAENHTACSCADNFYRGTVCKHALAVVVSILQRPEKDNLIHLWWPDGTAALCGERHPRRFWIRWNYNALSWPDVCPTCVHTWTHPGKES